MSLRSSNLNVMLQWSQRRTNTGTNPTTQSGNMSFDVPTIDSDSWDEIFYGRYAVSATVDYLINFKDLFNFVSCDPVIYSRVLAIFIKNLGDTDGAGNGVVRVGTLGVADPVTLWWPNYYSADLLPGMCSFHACQPDLMGGTVYDCMQVTDDNKNFAIEWISGSESTIEISVLGSTLVTG